MGRVDEDPGLKPLSLFLTIFRGLKAPAPSDEILTCSEGIFALKKLTEPQLRHPVLSQLARRATMGLTREARSAGK